MLLLLMCSAAWAANITVTVDNTKADEFVSWKTAGEANAPQTLQQKADWLKAYILAQLQSEFKLMRNIKNRQAENSTTETGAGQFAS